MEGIINSTLKTVVAYFLLLFLSRLIGRKMMSQMTFFDFVIGITIGTITANIALGAKANSLISANVLIIISLLAIATDYLHLKSFQIRKLVNSEPIVLIKNGKIIKENMKKTRFAVNDLLMKLREKNIFNIADVEFAVIETDGKLSVLPKSQKQPLTPAQLSIPTDYEGLTSDIIIDGKIMEDNLEQTGFNKEWLLNQLEDRDIQSPTEVLYAGLDTAGNLYISKQNGSQSEETEGKYGIE